MNIGELESALFSKMPRTWAEPWDKVGMSIGDPQAQVVKVAMALDASTENVRHASECGANVLVTHHPIALSMPDAVTPSRLGGGFASNCIWEAVSRGIAVLSFHTNLDRHPMATLAIPKALGIEAVPGLESGRPSNLGKLGSIASLLTPVPLEMLAHKCKEKLGGVAQVYGDIKSTVRTVGFFTGSVGDSGIDAVKSGCDLVVCGECGYHKAIDLVWRGCSVIVLGHDISEFPLVGVIESQLEAVGIPSSMRVRLPERPSWSTI